MKRWILMLLAAAVLLCACGSKDNDNGEIVDAAHSQEDVLPAEPVYGIKDEVRANEFRHEDSGEVYASYEYHFPMMYLMNEDKLSADVLESAQHNVEMFNALMQQELDEAVSYGESMVDELYGGSMPLVDEVTSSVICQGQIVTVVRDGYYYGGGAHPFTHASTYTFDLSSGQFIDPTQIGDDPEAFRVQAGQMLVAYAESLGEDYTMGFWADYAEIISHWNNAAVIFGEDGMTVIFSVYELGPYAMGSVELFLAYKDISEAIGEGGLQHLGIATAG